jgi:hypothetical protein
MNRISRREFVTLAAISVLEMAQWVKSFTPEIPLDLFRTGEPFWIPK